ncbi:galactan 5-O-arabinofuranosyltransferase [Corynebacterium incognita]|uniref:Galactan 5-O-arabinofuranosyltransferase n=1 Tax=Corynebacterium incognita TaxID=2754725 RepID=A0A7G7CM90_9CORY|nr:galactan 5-O-arabinofuranosyltransferase [Corynebacterium incognita]QNE88706.1 galactan 5-O-arabinofuranosyltransferase [Corynebacterium incognita]
MSIADSATGIPSAIGLEGESGSIVRPQLREKAYASDLPTLKRTVFGILLAIFGGSAVTLLAWKILKATSLPAFNTSMVTRALSTFALAIFLVALAVLLFFWLRDESHAAKSESTLSRPRWRIWLTYALSYLSPAFLTITTLGIPLSASRLWLDGIQVDQVFRTQFLTRMTETAANQDMAYIDMPTYYPIGWFWLGGRLANLLGMPGWEVYQPWALVSLAAAGCLLVPVWQRLTGSLPVATAIALTTMAICLTLNAEEPYGAVVAMGIPAAAVMARRALLGRWSASLALALYLGLSATFYTLFTGVAALAVATLIALVLAITHHTWQPILHLVVIGVTSLAIAAIAWAPYLLASWRSADPVQSAAQSYLPGEGTETPFPFLAPSIIGVLCFLGVVYIVFRFRDPDVKVMTAALLGVYAWTLASMAFTVAGTTLLGFRTTVIIVMQLATLGVLALADARLVGIHRFYPERFSPEVSARVTALFLILCTAGGIFYAQSIPKENQTAIDHAYSDTDGYGERADRYAPDSTKYYAEIVDRLHEWGHPFEDTVVLADETHFMGYYPYYGFNAFTNHYANPLGNYNARASHISDWGNRSWGDLKNPQKFLDELDAAPWHAPDVMLFRGDLENKEEGFKTHIAEDIYPNQPNNRYVSVLFNPAVFSEELWHVEQFGPFVVVARK